MKKPIEPVVVNNTQMPAEILASAIKDVADGAKKLLASRLSRRAILVLLKDSTNVSMAQIDLVLEHAAKLDKYIVR